MKSLTWIAVLASACLVSGQDAFAGLCGASSYDCCPPQCCAPTGDYCTAKAECVTYKTVKEEFTSRVAMDGIATPPASVAPRTLSPDSGATSIATRPLGGIGGERLQSDPPRGGRYR